MASVQQLPSRDEMFNHRLPVIIVGMVVISALLILKLSFAESATPISEHNSKSTAPATGTAPIKAGEGPKTSSS